ncbi:MAG: hypothetical protein IMW89_12205 [Ktedonobacteraceae bacterium]|nr:hypothetical protein [Ktedonobacteraceae bacterium]
MSFSVHLLRSNGQKRHALQLAEGVRCRWSSSVMEAQPLGMALALLTLVVGGTIADVPIGPAQLALCMLGLLWWAMLVASWQMRGHVQRGGQRTPMLALLRLGSLLLVWGLVVGPYVPALWRGSDLGVVIIDLLLLFWLWRRSLARARTGFEYASLASSFKVSLGILLAVLVLAVLVPRGSSLLSALEGSLTLFFLSGLVALSLARLASVRTLRLAAGEQADPTRFWLLALALFGCGLTALVLVLEALFSYGSLIWLVTALRPVWEMLGTLLGWLLYVLLLIVLSPLFALFSWLFNLIGLSKGQPVTIRQPVSPFSHLANAQHPVQLAPQWLVAGQWTALALIALLLIVLVRAALRQWVHAPERAHVDETRERLDRQAILAERRQRHRDRRQATAGAENVPLPAADSARAYYRLLLSSLAQARPEAARHLDETPLEYEARLHPVLNTHAAPADADEPSALSIFHQLTEDYLCERYGQQQLEQPRRAYLRTWVPRLIRRLTGQTWTR